MASVSSEVTTLLRQWSAGDERARDRLIPLLYDRLRELAHQRLGGASVDNSLNTTELVHEAYIRLVDAPRVDPDRAPFFWRSPRRSCGICSSTVLAPVSPQNAEEA